MSFKCYLDNFARTDVGEKWQKLARKLNCLNSHLVEDVASAQIRQTTVTQTHFVSHLSGWHAYKMLAFTKPVLCCMRPARWKKETTQLTAAVI